MAPFDVTAARERICSTEHPDSAGEHLKKASVFMLLRSPETSPTILAILKADNKGYPWANQVALPGGHQDPVDFSPLATAYRELEEETGILSSEVDYIGSLGHFQTINSTEIEAFFGIWEGDEEEVVYDASEIARIVMIPLKNLVKTHHEKAYTGRVPGWEELLYPVEDMTVWGATARILHYFTELLLV
ncbi:CoA pyrophosphatase [Desulfoluna sp.]|uniref:NUDIX hydrolase n=1 Tax=Desulfoluna sp. TaxID=2045199 RepID=UPI002632B83E|nr:CoA pyrophosphatase [Desulfoluna sp.]